ncbi:DoxX family protein [Amycolatopsis benzoatilytica]|uniref:DoxX family protein n=1 Tax=Amycolatopsis benzoatilytica TaxID=346045 RepID=UPI000376F2DC|nr:DoxX family protein [Amycolatopsis benzoatilytica]
MHRLDAARDYAIGLFRIVIGFLFACHGVKTLFGVLGAHDPAPAGAWPGWWAALIQLVAGVLVLLGIGSRLAALLGSGSMAFAYFTVHLPKALFPIENGGEAAAMFCWTLLILAFVGPGRFALAGALSPLRPRESRVDAVPRA